MIYLNIEHLEEKLPAFKEQWQKSLTGSFSSVVIDDLLIPSKKQEIFDNFPSDAWLEWNDVGDSLQYKKLSCERIQVFPSSLSILVNELNSGPVLHFLENLTGIKGLVPDPYLWGGGLHLTQPGGYLNPHTDFLQGQTPNLMRVINLVLYAHPEWTEEMGGQFQTWSGNSLTQNIIPAPGRCVIFNTHSRSVHGVARVKGSVLRKSIALFYYVMTEKQSVFLDHTTGWQLNLIPEDSQISAFKRVISSALMRASFALKNIAAALNKKAEDIVTFRKGSKKDSSNP